MAREMRMTLVRCGSQKSTDVSGGAVWRLGRFGWYGVAMVDDDARLLCQSIKDSIELCTCSEYVEDIWLIDRQ